MRDDVLLEVGPLGFPWRTEDPFLFCVHHDDAYPAGNEKLGPRASLTGRNIGQDFEGKDGWRMYHGDVVPGFPQHPHRGFETVTFVRQGYIDHSDSLGATARFGRGDVQWLTAGRGINHSEMFPLLDREQPNPLELFQIWLNLPKSDKLVEPHFSMLWSHMLARHVASDESGRRTEITLIAGHIGDAVAPAPPPHSWAANPDHDVAIWTIALEPNAIFTLPRAHASTNRSLYFFRGRSLALAGQPIDAHAALKVRADADVTIENGSDPSELLLLQAKPIIEPVVQYGPFVMNSRAEIQQAILDYQRTSFGGWPWPTNAPVHAREAGRFAKHADGRVEEMNQRS
jgi:redox-sensitive bicupin YhaK (pirin superfamily)